MTIASQVTLGNLHMEVSGDFRADQRAKGCHFDGARVRGKVSLGICAWLGGGFEASR